MSSGWCKDVRFLVCSRMKLATVARFATELHMQCVRDREVRNDQDTAFPIYESTAGRSK